MNKKFSLFTNVLLCIRVYIFHSLFSTYELIIIVIFCSQTFLAHFCRYLIHYFFVKKYCYISLSSCVIDNYFVQWFDYVNSFYTFCSSCSSNRMVV